MRTLHYKLSFSQFMALGFCAIFFTVALALNIVAVDAIVTVISGKAGVTEALIKSISMAVVALAIFELGLVINTEYAGCETSHPVSVVLHRTLPRFVSIVCIALVLEGLLMVIKYSQLKLAGNLYYPVAIIISASTLLASLGVFLHLSAGCLQREVAESAAAPNNRSVGRSIVTKIHGSLV